jgi:hypothetical protein
MQRQLMLGLVWNGGIENSGIVGNAGMEDE